MSDLLRPVPERWRQAEAEAKSHIKLLNDTVLRMWEPVAITVVSGILEPFLLAVKQAISVHATLTESFSEKVNWKKVTTYRIEAARSVLGLIREDLERQNKGSMLGGAYLSLFEALDPIVSGAPGETTLPPSSKESTLTGSRTDALRERKVSVRTLFRNHVHGRLGRLIESHHRQLQEYMAGVVGLLESGFTEWVHGILDTESKIDRQHFRSPDLIPEAWETEIPGAKEGLIEHAEKLQNTLESIVEESSMPDIEMHDSLMEVATAFEEELDQAGVYQRQLVKIRMPTETPQAMVRGLMKRRTVWHAEVVDRMKMGGCLLNLRSNSVKIGEKLLRDVDETTLGPVRKAFGEAIEELSSAEEKVQSLCREAEVSLDTAMLGDSMKSLQEDTLKVLRHLLTALPGFLNVEEMVRTSTEAYLQALPETLSLHNLERKAVRSRVLNMRRVVEESVLQVDDSFGETSDTFRTEFTRVWRTSEQVIHVVKSNIDLAIDVLSNSEGAKQDIENVCELASGGLHRAEQNLSSLREALNGPWKTFESAVFDHFHDQWASLHLSLKPEVLLEEQWVNLQLGLRRGLRRLPREINRFWDRHVRRGWRLARYGRNRVRTLIEQGRSAIGVTEASREVPSSSVDALSPAGIQELRKRFPLVYRKLFSFEALRDNSMLKGRDADLQKIESHFRRWKSGFAAGALVLPMPQGSGRTSLLNVLTANLCKESNVQIIHLNARLTTDGFARKIAGVFGLEESSLDRLEARLLASPRAEPARVCLIDNLEHLMIRSLNGSETFERVLIFFSRTDSKVCWISTIGDVAWHYMEKTRFSAVGLVTSWHPLAPSALMLAEIILSRQQFTGMALKFEELPPGSDRMRRRLRRARTPEARQEQLEADYFKRLYQFSGSNLMLALYYWLRHARYNSEESFLTIRSVEPLNFRFFASFDMARAFSMNAFLFHKTLTVSEHNRIFNMTDSETIYLLESLLNLRLLVAASENGETHTRIRPDERYRLHPLILHPTTQLLRERNIIY